MGTIRRPLLAFVPIVAGAAISTQSCNKAGDPDPAQVQQFGFHFDRIDGIHPVGTKEVEALPPDVETLDLLEQDLLAALFLVGHDDETNEAVVGVCALSASDASASFTSVVPLFAAPAAPAAPAVLVPQFVILDALPTSLSPVIVVDEFGQHCHYSSLLAFQAEQFEKQKNPNASSLRKQKLSLYPKGAELAQIATGALYSIGGESRLSVMQVIPSGTTSTVVERANLDANVAGIGFVGSAALQIDFSGVVIGGDGAYAVSPTGPTTKIAGIAAGQRLSSAPNKSANGFAFAHGSTGFDVVKLAVGATPKLTQRVPVANLIAVDVRERGACTEVFTLSAGIVTAHVIHSQVPDAYESVPYPGAGPCANGLFAAHLAMAGRDGEQTAVACNPPPVVKSLSGARVGAQATGSPTGRARMAFVPTPLAALDAACVKLGAGAAGAAGAGGAGGAGGAAGQGDAGAAGAGGAGDAGAGGAGAGGAGGAGGTGMGGAGAGAAGGKAGSSGSGAGGAAGAGGSSKVCEAPGGPLPMGHAAKGTFVNVVSTFNGKICLYDKCGNALNDNDAVYPRHTMTGGFTNSPYAISGVTVPLDMDVRLLEVFPSDIGDQCPAGGDLPGGVKLETHAPPAPAAGAPILVVAGVPLDLPAGTPKKVCGADGKSDCPPELAAKMHMFASTCKASPDLNASLRVINLYPRLGDVVVTIKIAGKPFGAPLSLKYLEESPSQQLPLLMNFDFAQFEVTATNDKGVIVGSQSLIAADAPCFSLLLTDQGFSALLPETDTPSR